MYHQVIQTCEFKYNAHYIYMACIWFTGEPLAPYDIRHPITFIVFKMKLEPFVIFFYQDQALIDFLM